MTIKTYSELIGLKTFEERFRYLKLDGIVGWNTFGSDRIFNQRFYTSTEWKRLRNQIIVRDNGCDLGVPGHEICNGQKIIIHHLNPITMDDIVSVSDYLTNPEYLITTIHSTHNAIHYSDDNSLFSDLVERCVNDTCLWKRLTKT